MRHEPSTRPAAWRLLALAVIAAAGLTGIVGSGGVAVDCLFCGPGTPLPWIEVFVAPPELAVQAGDSATFYANVSGNPPPPYQISWCRQARGGGPCVVVPGATGTIFTWPEAARDDDGALFVATARNGNTVGSGQATLRVSNTPPIVFEDGEFMAADWESAAVATPAGIAPVVHVERAESGGNPGAYRRTVLDVPAGGSEVFVLHLARAATYEPAVQGALYGIDVTWDTAQLSPLPVDGAVETGILVEQGGRRYVRAGYSGLDGPGFGWRPSPRAEPGYPAQPGEFLRVDGPACGPADTCRPDFSASAPPLRFGVAHFVRNVEGQPATTVVLGLDNFRVVLWRR